MGFGIKGMRGHDPANDYLYGPAPDQRKRLGFTGDTGPGFENEDGDIVHIADDPSFKKGGSSFSVTGEGYDENNNWKQHGTSAYDKAVAGYRQEGADAQKRSAVQPYQGAANQSRRIQMGGLGLMRTAAEGDAPSRAQALGIAANDATTRSAVGNMAAARGPGAAVASANAAGSGAAGRFASTNAQATDMRGAEMAKNQQEFAKSAQDTRGQDIGAATQNAQYQAYQNALNEAKQQGKENLGYDTRDFQAKTAMEYEKQKNEANRARQSAFDRRNAEDDAALDQDISTTASIAMLATDSGSDERMKRGIRPVTMGSLSGLTRFMHGR